MKNRTLKELYQILYYYVKDQETIMGLCNWICIIYNRELITIDEQRILENHFRKQKPQKGILWGLFFSKHYKWTKGSKFIGNSYWWKKYVSDEERKAFILYLISKL